VLLPALKSSWRVVLNSSVMEWFVFTTLRPLSTARPFFVPVHNADSSFLIQIYRAAVKLWGDMSQISCKLSENILAVAGHGLFGIENYSDQTFLTFPDGSKFALLNDHTAPVLRSVVKMPSIQFDALVDLTTLHETIARANKASEATLRVNINLYGSRETRETVGDQLSAGKIYLQHPEQQRPASVYDNPHVLDLPEIPLQSVDIKPQEAVESVLRGDKANPFHKAVFDVYSSLKRGSHLRRLVGGIWLKTSLLP
jgi:SWI/SNF-related matrix-associated actin-dependent regulator of chromatin subfamily A3